MKTSSNKIPSSWPIDTHLTTNVWISSGNKPYLAYPATTATLSVSFNSFNPNPLSLTSYGFYEQYFMVSLVSLHIVDAMPMDMYIFIHPIRL